MKGSKGKEYIQPDRSWIIEEYKNIKHSKNKRLYIKQFNRKIRNFFKKIINAKNEENQNEG